MASPPTDARVSRRIAAIAESATLAVDAKAKALKAAGEPVIGFGAGEPDFPTPDHIVEAAVAACRDPKNHQYTPAGGLPELKEAIVAKTIRDSGYEVPAAQVLVTNGGKHAVYNTFATLLDPGDEVLLPAPYWTTYPEPIALAGGVVGGAAHRRDAAASGSPSSSSRRPAPRAPRCSCSCRPSNPTGAVYPPEEVEAIGRWAVEHGIWVVTDEIYEHLTYGDHRVHARCPCSCPSSQDRCVVLNGVAKTYAMTGWRVGWMLGPDDIDQGRHQPAEPRHLQRRQRQPAGRPRRADRRPVGAWPRCARRSSAGASSCTSSSPASRASPRSSRRAPSTPSRTSSAYLDRPIRGRTARDHPRAVPPPPRRGQGGDRPRRGLRRARLRPAVASPWATTTWARASAASPTSSPRPDRAWPGAAERAVLPFGSWPTPITSELVVRAAAAAQTAAGRRRRRVVVRGPPGGGRPHRGAAARTPTAPVTEVLPAPWNARTGRPRVRRRRVVGPRRRAVVRRLGHAAAPPPRAGRPSRCPSRPSPTVARGLRYADGARLARRRWMLCVREEHHADGSEATNTIVRLSAPTAPSTRRWSSSGPDFVADPRWRADGGAYCWLEWDHPDMPWDATRLTVDEGGVRTRGGRGRPARVDLPAHLGGGRLAVVLLGPHRVLEPLPVDADRRRRDRWSTSGTTSAFPQWVFGQSCFALLDDGRVAFVVPRRRARPPGDPRARRRDPRARPRRHLGRPAAGGRGRRRWRSSPRRPASPTWSASASTRSARSRCVVPARDLGLEPGLVPRAASRSTSRPRAARRAHALVLPADQPGRRRARRMSARRCSC